MTARPTRPAPIRAAALLLALAAAGCGLAPRPVLRLIAPAGAAAPWWAGVDDPLLADLIARGTGRDAGAPADTAALAIGLAYLDARRAQQHVTLREDAVAGLGDNAVIAGFRREAGLVSAVDTGLAGVLVGLNDNAMMAARSERDAAVARLAALTGLDAAALSAEIAAAPAPRVWDAADIAVDDAVARRGDIRALAARLAAGLARHRVTQAQIDAALANDRAPPANPRPSPAAAAIASLHAAEAHARAEIVAADAALAVARARLSAATATANAAETTLSDARLAYRTGKDAMAALYVAEAAALAAREGLADAGLAVDAALIRLWTAQGRGAGAAAPPAPP